MEEELLAQLCELRSATDQLKTKMNATATAGSRWVETIDTLLKRRDLLGLAQVYAAITMTSPTDSISRSCGIWRLS
jgi:hypothetical protein